MKIRIDHQIKLIQGAEILLPLAVVFGIGGWAIGLCTTAIMAGFLLWEWQLSEKEK
jgi:hypothetical protein